MLELDYPTSGIKIRELANDNLLKPLYHGDLDINHWIDLYEVTTAEISCGNGCINNAKFVLFEHDHYNKEYITTSCEDHCHRSYLELLNNRTAG